MGGGGLGERRGKYWEEKGIRKGERDARGVFWKREENEGKSSHGEVNSNCIYFMLSGLYLERENC